MDVYPEDAPTALGFDVIVRAIRSELATEAGRKHLSGAVPASDRDVVVERLSAVTDVLSLRRLGSAPGIPELPDLGVVLPALAPKGGMLDGPDLHDIVLLLEASRRWRTAATTSEEPLQTLSRLADGLYEDRALEKRIDKAIAPDGSVRDDASDELKRLFRKRAEAERSLQRALRKEQEAADKAGYAADGGPTIRNGRLVLPIRAEGRRKVGGLVHDVSATGQTVFVEPVSVLESNNAVFELDAAIRAERARILKAISDELRPLLPQLLGSHDRLAELDLIRSRARLAERINGVVPVMNEGDPVVELRGARNAALMLHLEAAGREAEPLDLTLGGAERQLVITGPNAGGKTVALKTLGLTALMLAHGIPVPLDEKSRFPLFGRLLVDIGDAQSIEHDLSTFTAHVTRLAHIARQSDANTLVLIDEAGTGTDPIEGAALARALLEHLDRAGALAVVTTHHRALTAYAHETPSAVNGSMAFDPDTYAPTYRFRQDRPGSSFGIEIAGRVGLPEALLLRARELVGDQQVRLGDLLDTLEAEAAGLRAEREALDRAGAEAENERAHWAALRQELDASVQGVRSEALAEAQAIVREANARVERTIREIKEAQAAREATRETRGRLERFAERVDRKLQATGGEGRSSASGAPGSSSTASGGLSGPADRDRTERGLQVGDAVTIDDGEAIGEVEAVRKRKAVVVLGTTRVTVDTKRLRPANKPVARTRKGGGYSTSGSSSAVAGRFRVDVRGQRVEEAILEVARLLDEARVGGLNRIEILHGKGTGALREGIRAYLAGEEGLPDAADAPIEAGGAGVTVVELR